jgi:hypothetical protein
MNVFYLFKQRPVSGILLIGVILICVMMYRFCSSGDINTTPNQSCEERLKTAEQSSAELNSLLDTVQSGMQKILEKQLQIKELRSQNTPDRDEKIKLLLQEIDSLVEQNKLTINRYEQKINRIDSIVEQNKLTINRYEQDSINQTKKLNYQVAVIKLLKENMYAQEQRIDELNAELNRERKKSQYIEKQLKTTEKEKQILGIENQNLSEKNKELEEENQEQQKELSRLQLEGKIKLYSRNKKGKYNELKYVQKRGVYQIDKDAEELKIEFTISANRYAIPGIKKIKVLLNGEDVLKKRQKDPFAINYTGAKTYATISIPYFNTLDYKKGQVLMLELILNEDGVRTSYEKIEVIR